jgi:acyl-homoserine lactone acylase PvdQ
VLNPDCGYLVNCNVAPQRVCPDAGIDLDDYPAYLVRDHGSDRQVRALQLFENGAPVTEARMRAFGLDVHMAAADVMENHFFTHYDADAHADLAEAAALLASEPNEATVDNRSVLLLQEWFLEIGGGPFFFYPADPAALTPAQVDGMFAALRRARDRLQACAHGLSPRWGDVHVIERGETFPLGGGSGIIGTLFNASGPNEPCGPVVASQGSSFLQVSVLDPAGVRSVSVRPLGASSDPASPHYNDETARFAARDPETSYKPSLFAPEAFMGEGLESATDLRAGG